MAKEKDTKPKKEKKKRWLGSRLIWGGLGLVILIIGAGAALYFFQPELMESDPRLRVVKDFLQETLEKGQSTFEETLQKTREVAGSATEKLGGLTDVGFLGGRSHTVQPGENLWAIARGGALVDNAWEWRTILLQNADKIEYAFISAEEGAWKVMMATGQRLTVSGGGKSLPEIDPGKRYAFQLASMSAAQLGRARFVVRTLMKDGYYAYLVRHDQAGQTWYRIRSGFYDSKEAASARAEEIRGRYTQRNFFPEPAWVIRPSAEEVRGEGMAFGAQLAYPWVVEMADRDTHGDALRDLRQVSGAGFFAYIWQTRNPSTERFIYRVRVGFFSSQEQANRIIEGKQGGVWESARTAKVTGFEETLPGQKHILGDAS